MKNFFTYLYFCYCCIILIIFFIVVLPLALFAAIFLGKNAAPVIYFCAKVWFRLYSTFAGLKWQNIGSIIPNKNQAYIFVANHNSYYDILAMVLSTHQPYRILGKEEMTKIPVFGYLYGKAVITVKRKSEDDRKKSVARLKYYLGKSISIYIFPEGTFNNTPNLMKQFYDGAFKMALETKTPLQPLVIHNCKSLLTFDKNLQIKPGKATYEFLPAITIEEMESHNIQTLKELVYLRMEIALMKYGNKYKKTNLPTK